jgi:hypothetical protein
MSTIDTELVSAWDYYVSAIEFTKQAVMETARFRDNPDHRAQGLAAVMGAQAMSYNFAFLPRANYPRVFGQTTWSPIYTVGGASGNFLYGGVILDGKRTYRATGRMGDLKLFLIQVFDQVVGAQGFKSLRNYDCSTFEMDEDGRFEIVFSATEQDGNWIPIVAESAGNFIMMRRIFGDWNDDLGDIDVRLVGEHGDNDDLVEASMARRLILAADILKYNVTLNQIWFYDHCLEMTGGEKNTTYVMPGNDLLNIAGSPTSNYANGVYEIKPDEALIIEVDAPQTAYWEYHLYDVWLLTPDITNHQSEINQQRAAFDSDGKVRVVIALEDPGIQNWLDPAGRLEGLIVFRNYRAIEIPNPTCRLVKMSELFQHLPADTARCTPAQRVEQLEYRRSGLLNLYK